MKNQIYHILPLAEILILLSVASGYAQTSVALKATIPFGFKFQNETLPAGDYTIGLSQKEVICSMNPAASVVVFANTFQHLGK